MRAKNSASFLLLAVLVVSTSAVPATARLVLPVTWENLTLVTTDGWEYPDVAVELLIDGNLLRITNESGAEKILPVSLVRTLRDASGHDVTARVLAPPNAQSGQAPVQQPASVDATDPPPPGAAEPTAELAAGPMAGSTAEPKGIRGNYPEPLPSSVGAPRFRWALSGGLGYGFSSENGFGGQGNGLTLSGKIRMAMSQSVYVVLGARYVDLEAQDGAVRPAYAQSGGGFHADMEELFFGIGLMPRAASLMQALPYLELGAGRVANSRASWLLFPGKDQVASAGLPRHESAVRIQVGVMLPLDPTVGLDLGFGWSYIGEDLLDWGGPDELPLAPGAPPSSASDRSNRSILGIHAGLVLFGGTP